MDVTDIGAFEAKTRLSELLEQVSKGRVFRITRRGKPIAELRPLTTTRKRPTFGSDRGRGVMSPDFDAPLPEFEPYTK
jgi:prevent-host-death family protein